MKIKQVLEDKIDALILASGTTIYEPLKKEIAHDINTLNFLYEAKFGQEYNPR